MLVLSVLATRPPSLILVLLSRSFGGTFVGKCTNLHDQPGKLARSLKALFQGCSQLFEFVDQRQDTFQVFSNLTLQVQ